MTQILSPSPVPYATTILVRDCCLCLHTQRAARALARRFDAALKPAGITSGQFSLLMALNRPDAPTMASVAGLLAMDRTTLTAALKPLVRRGLVHSAMSGTDRRARLLSLTAEGMAVLAAAVPIWTSLHAQIETGLPSAGRLREDLTTLSRANGIGA